MVRYRFNQQLTPPAPFVHVTLERPDGAVALENLPAQLDTAADMSVIPAGFVERLKLVQFDAIPVIGFGGILRNVPTFLVRLSIRQRPAAILEVLAGTEELHILLGRDILNRHRILLDGPNALVEVD